MNFQKLFKNKKVVVVVSCLHHRYYIVVVLIRMKKCGTHAEGTTMAGCTPVKGIKEINPANPIRSLCRGRRFRTIYCN